MCKCLEHCWRTKEANAETLKYDITYGSSFEPFLSKFVDTKGVLSCVVLTPKFWSICLELRLFRDGRTFFDLSFLRCISAGQYVSQQMKMHVWAVAHCGVFPFGFPTGGHMASFYGKFAPWVSWTWSALLECSEKLAAMRLFGYFSWQSKQHFAHKKPCLVCLKNNAEAHTQFKSSLKQTLGFFLFFPLPAWASTNGLDSCTHSSLSAQATSENNLVLQFYYNAPISFMPLSLELNALLCNQKLTSFCSPLKRSSFMKTGTIQSVHECFYVNVCLSVCLYVCLRMPVNKCMCLWLYLYICFSLCLCL